MRYLILFIILIFCFNISSSEQAQQGEKKAKKAQEVADEGNKQTNDKGWGGSELLNKSGDASNVPAPEITKGNKAMKTERVSKKGTANTNIGKGENKAKKADAIDDEGSTTRPGRDAGITGSASGGASSGGTSVEGAATQSSGDNSSGLLRNKKKGTANTNVGKGENKAKKADAIDDEGSVGSTGGKPVKD